MQKFIFLVVLAATTMFSATAFAQPTIIFRPSENDSLTWQDVDSILDEYGLSWQSSYHAIIEDANIIGGSAFNNHQKLISASSESATKIETNAFYNDLSLESISFPNVEHIGKSVFNNCNLLQSISFPRIKYIDTNAFRHCSSLESIEFGGDFAEPTEIEIKENAFLYTPEGTYDIINNTPNIELKLGDNVLPCWNPITNEWNGYIWKSISGGCKLDTFTLTVRVYHGVMHKYDSIIYCVYGDTIPFFFEDTICYRFDRAINTLYSNPYDPDAFLISTEPAFEVVVNFSFVMRVNYVVTAQYELNIVSNGGGTTAWDGLTIIDCGTMTYIPVTPDAEHEFVNWTDASGNELSTNVPGMFYIYSDTTIIANFQTVSIKERALVDLKIIPNPASSIAILQFDLLEAGFLKISLNDLAGSKLLELHNSFEAEGIFIKEFSLDGLFAGVYFLRLEYNGKVQLAKVVKE